jgi:excisionase family DNA binding protein
MFLLPREAAALAGLSTRAIYRAIQRGELSAVKLCSRLRISRVAFEEWVERSAVVPEPAAPVESAPSFGPAPQGSFRRLLEASPNEDGAA